MPNNINYATLFESELLQKYKRELLTDSLTTHNVRFTGANTIRVPNMALAGYKDHGRNGGFNRQNVNTTYMPFTLAHDRDVEFFVDVMDVDESNQAASAANLTNTFEAEHAIPETDCYRISKLYADFIAAGGTASATALTEANILSVFDDMMLEMDDNEVPYDGRILYVTPGVENLLKNTGAISRTSIVDTATGAIKRTPASLDDVQILKIPSNRMKTAYDFTDGCQAAAGAKQINMILAQPKSVIACDKHSYIKLWEPGTHTQGDGYLYQNRKYGDLFLLPNRAKGVALNITN